MVKFIFTKFYVSNFMGKHYFVVTLSLRNIILHYFDNKIIISGTNCKNMT